MSKYLLCILLLILNCLSYTKSKTTRNKSSQYFNKQIELSIKLSPLDVGISYQMLKIMDQIFNENGIKYWGFAGTILGAIRHKGIIPWDDDVDVAAFEQEREAITKLNPLFNQYGFKIANWPFAGLRVVPESSDYPRIDIFLAKKTGSKITFAYPGPTKNYPRYYLFQSEISSLIRLPFGPVKLNFPHNPIRFIHTAYGPDALQYAVLKFQGNLKLKINDFSPAPYEINDQSIPLN